MWKEGAKGGYVEHVYHAHWRARLQKPRQKKNENATFQCIHQLYIRLHPIVWQIAYEMSWPWD